VRPKLLKYLQDRLMQWWMRKSCCVLLCFDGGLRNPGPSGRRPSRLALVLAFDGVTGAVLRQEGAGQLYSRYLDPNPAGQEASRQDGRQRMRREHP
jgi:hypothetical protein